MWEGPYRVWDKEPLGMENVSECLLSWDLQVFKISFLKFLLFSSLLLFCLPNSLFTPLFCFCFVFWKQEHFGKGKSADFQLFGSPLGKDLLFKDSAFGLLRVPPKMDYRLYLGHSYVTAIRNQREGVCKYSGRARCFQECGEPGTAKKQL